MYDVALILFEKERQKGIDAVNHAEEVDVNDPLPHFGWRTNGRARRHAGVIEDHVDRTKLGERRIAQGDHVLLLRDIGCYSECLHATHAKTFNDSRESLAFNVTEHEIDAGLRQLLRRREAN